MTFSALKETIKSTFGFKRLFWRIFLAFWMASLIVMVATGFVLVNKYSSDEYKQRFTNNAINQAQRIVWQYEHELSVNSSPRQKLKEWKIKHPNRNGEPIPMLIQDENGNTVYHYKMNKVKPDERVEQYVTGLFDQRYKVQIRQPQAPRIYKELLYRFQSLQFIFIFIASALVSAILSWSIIRPINYLGAFSRRYANKQEITALPRTLSARGDELGDLATDINFMVHKTHEASRSQQQLLHDVSHELRAPLARLQASAALIEQKNPDNRHVKQIHHDCERIDQLIQQILDYSKLEKSAPVAENCDINQLCERVIDNMAISYPGIPIQFSPANNAHIQGYPEAIYQALDNIIGNACKYSSKGQLVEVNTKMDEKNAIITVQDHGPGVDEEEIEKLLQPFYRAGNQMHTEGFGLGLSIALKAVRKHGGKLNMFSPENEGLRVEIILPLKPNNVTQPQG